MIKKLAVVAVAAAAISACGIPIEDGNTVDSGSTDAKTVTFKVWGKAPKGADITYGDDSSNLDGTKLPFETTMPFNPDALYYAVTAQLNGRGQIKCSVTIGDKTKTGQARGDYNICSAQLSVW